SPSKRAVQNTVEQVTVFSEEESDQFHTYLLQEISEIIEQCRRRERPWHIRLSICRSVNRNIESTFLVEKDDVEKEEANLIRIYFQQAIARIAAADNASK
ncbi:putative eka-like protein, partial [Golovinomyces cichoracearum]